MNKVVRWIQEHRHYKNLELKAARIYITKHKIHFPLFIKVFFRQMRKDSIQERAAAMAFNFTLSIFPFIIFLFTLIPYIPIPDLNNNILSFLSQILPKSIYLSASATISDIVNIPRGGLLSFGFLFALSTATNGVNAMISAFNKCYRTAERRNFLYRLLLSVGLVFFISLILFITIGLSILSKFYLDYLEKRFAVDQVLTQFYGVLFLKYFTLLIIFFTTISVIYIVAPTVRTRWSFFSLGSLFASIVGLLFSVGFSFYIEQFNSYNKIYGSIGAFIGIMVWLYAICIVLLVGFEINASIDHIKNQLLRRILK